MTKPPHASPQRPSRRAAWLRRAAVRLAVAAVCLLPPALLRHADAQPDALPPAAQRVVYPKPVAEMEALARTDALAFLRESLRWYEERVACYTCRFLKTEQRDGKLRDTETIDMKFREKPFSVYMKWVKNPSKDQEVIFVEGRYDEKAVVHPAGILGVLFRKVTLDPEGSLAMKNSRRPVTCAGMANMLRVILPQCEEAQVNGDLRLVYLGIRDNDGRPAYVFNRILPRGKGYASHQVFIYIDRQYLLPVRTEAYLWNGELLSHYAYNDLVLNPSLTDDDFDPDNKAYAFRLF